MERAMNDDSAPPPQHAALKATNPKQPFVWRNRRSNRWVVDHDNAEKSGLARFIQNFTQARGLPAFEISACHEWSRSACRSYSYERHIAAHAQIRKSFPANRCRLIVARHPSLPRAAALAECARHIRVVIAGYDRHIFGLAECFQPKAGHLKLGVKREVHQIASYGEMIRIVRLDVIRNGGDDSIMQGMPTIAVPVDVADHALGSEFSIGYVRQRTEMDIRNMGEPEHSMHLGQCERSCHLGNFS